MNIKGLERPQRIDIFTSVQLTVPKDDYENNPEIMEMSVLIEIKKIENEPNVKKIFNEVKNDLHKLTKNVIINLIDEYEVLSCKISKLSRLSEKINRLLKSILNFYLKENEINEIIERNNKCKQLKDYFSKGNMTFNQLKNILSCIIKTDDKFHQINELNTTDKRKMFTKTLYNYIYDRDCFTHGNLFYLFPNYTPILEVKPPNEKSHYIIISNKIITDNMKIHIELQKVLNKIILLVQGYNIKQTSDNKEL